MENIDDYIPKLNNKEKIQKLTDKIVNIELKIGKNDSKRLIIKKCIEETEINLKQLQHKASQHPENEKIADEIRNSQNRIKEGHKILKNLNEKLSRREIALLKIKQEKNREIKSGLTKYLDKINSDCEELRQEEINADKQHNNNKNELEKIGLEIEHIKRLIG